jgi:hypothetical protein
MPIIDRNRHRHIVYSYLSNSNNPLIDTFSLRYRHSRTVDGGRVYALSVADRMSSFACSVLVIGPKKVIDPINGLSVDCSEGFVANIVHGFQADKDVLNFTIDYKWNKQSTSGVFGNIKDMIASVLDEIARADINVTMAIGDFVESITKFLLPILDVRPENFQNTIKGILHLITQGKIVLPEKEFAIFDGFEIKTQDLEVKKTYITLTDDPKFSSINMAINEMIVLDLLPKFLVGKYTKEDNNKVYRRLRVESGGGQILNTNTRPPDLSLPLISTDYRNAVLSTQAESLIELPNTIEATLYQAYTFTIGIHLANFASKNTDADEYANRYIFLGEDTLSTSFGDYDYEKALNDLLKLNGEFSADWIKSQVKSIIGVSLDNRISIAQKLIADSLNEEAIGLYFLLFLLDNFKIPKDGGDLSIKSIVERVGQFELRRFGISEERKNKVRADMEKAIEHLAMETPLSRIKRASLPDFDKNNSEKFKDFMHDVFVQAVFTTSIKVMPDPMEYLKTVDALNNIERLHNELDTLVSIYLPSSYKNVPNFYRSWYDIWISQTPFKTNNYEKAVIKAEALDYISKYVRHISNSAFAGYEKLQDISRPVNFIEQAGEALHKVLAALNFVQLFPPGGYNFIPNFPALVSALYNNKPCIQLSASSDEETGEGVTYYVGHYGILFRNIDRMRTYPVNDASRNGIFYMVPTKIHLTSSSHFTYSSSPERYGEFSYPTWLEMKIEFSPINTWIFLYGNFLGLENLIKLLNIAEGKTTSNSSASSRSSDSIVRNIDRGVARQEISRIMQNCKII